MSKRRQMKVPASTLPHSHSAPKTSPSLVFSFQKLNSNPTGNPDTPGERGGGEEKSHQCPEGRSKRLPGCEMSAGKVPA